MDLYKGRRKIAYQKTYTHRCEEKKPISKEIASLSLLIGKIRCGIAKHLDNYAKIFIIKEKI